MNREPKDILALLKLTLDSYFEHSKVGLTDEEQRIINRLDNWELTLDDQVMHLFESPMSNREFHDVVRQMLGPIVNSVFLKAKQEGVVPTDEHHCLDQIEQKLKL